MPTSLTLLSLAALFLFLPCHLAHAQVGPGPIGNVNGWDLTRCNPDGTPYTDPYYYRFGPTILHGPITLHTNALYPSYIDDWLKDGLLAVGWESGTGPYSLSNNSATSTLTADMTGQLVGYFHWTAPAGMGGPPMPGMPPPAPPAAPKPSYVDFLLTTNVAASGWCSSVYPVLPWQASAVVTASNSLGETVTSPSPALTGYHLLRVPVSQNGSGVAAVELDGTVHVGLYNAVPLFNSATVSATYNVFGTVGLDNREVTISANVDTTSKKVLTVDASGTQTTDANGDANFTSAPNTRTADGTMYGDTIYSYHNYVSGIGSDAFSTFVDVPAINWLSFTPTYAGNWHYKAGITQGGTSIVVPNVVAPDTWKWSPNESDDTWDLGICSMPWATNFSEHDKVPSGQDAPTTYNVGYTATDNTDGATASANYSMTVHDPYEANFPDHATYRNKENFKKYPDAQWVSSGDDPGKTYDLEVHTETSKSIDITISPGGILEKWIASTMAITIDVSASYDVSVGQGTTVKDVPPGWGTYCMSYECVDYHKGKLDQWGTRGYQGTLPYNLRVHENPAVGIQPAPLVQMSGAPPTPPS